MQVPVPSANILGGTRDDRLDRRTVRSVFQERFTAHVMARNYLRLYWRLCAAAGTGDVRRRTLATGP